jgi:purine nucleosidase
MNRIILDTDIGTDVDDALALLLALASPEVALEGVTLVHADVDTRAKIALKVLRLAGRTEVPVCKGVSLPLLRERKITWLGHEGEGIDFFDVRALPPDPRRAPDFIADSVTAAPGEVTLVPVGPLTNIAAAIILDPRVAETTKEIIVMGGCRGEIDGWRAEHNIASDPEAGRVVFGSGAPITMVGLDVTLQVTIDAANVARVRAVETPLAALTAHMLDQWLGAVRRDYTYLHDPLALALTIDRSLVTTQAMQVTIDADGRTVCSASRQPNAQVAVAVDAPRFEAFFVERLLQVISGR